MERSPFNASMPRAGIDPIRAASQALSIICASATTPPAHETLVLVLDQHHRGVGIMLVHNTRTRDAVHDVVRMGTHAVPGNVHAAAVVASIRPGNPADRSDIERWYACDAMLADAGIALLEWFVISDRIECPRTLTTDPPRWRP